MLQRSWSEKNQLTVFHLVLARVVTDLVRAQVAEGFRTVVACPPGGTLASDAAAAGARVYTWAAAGAPGLQLVRKS